MIIVIVRSYNDLKIDISSSRAANQFEIEKMLFGKKNAALIVRIIRPQ